MARPAAIADRADLALLSHHVGSGRLVRARRGLYRFRQYPSSPRDEVLAAWLAAGSGAVVSRESALDLLDLADIIPATIHLTIPRSRRGWRPAADVTLHTIREGLRTGETMEREGIRVTSPVRTILDVAEAGMSPDQVSLAIRQAVERGLVTRRQLREWGRERGGRVENLVTGALGALPS